MACSVVIPSPGGSVVALFIGHLLYAEHDAELSRPGPW